MPNPEKEKKIAALSERLSASRTVFLTDHSGMDVGTVAELRNRLRKVGAQYRVIKNSLTRLACDQADREELGRLIDGPSALVLIEGEDSVGPARVLAGFIRENELPVIRAGYDGAPRDDKWVERLATIPTKEVLVSQLIGLLSMPLRGLVIALSAPPRNLVMVLNQAAQRNRDRSAPG